MKRNSDIYSHNRINLMTGFFYASLGKTFRTMWAAGTVRMHMIPGVIRLGNDGKMNAVMNFLSTLLLTGGFAKAFSEPEGVLNRYKKGPLHFCEMVF